MLHAADFGPGPEKTEDSEGAHRGAKLDGKIVSTPLAADFGRRNRA